MGIIVFFRCFYNIFSYIEKGFRAIYFEFIMLTFEKSIELFNRINKVSDDYLRNEFIEKAIEYARIRTDWFFMDIETRRRQNRHRSIKHDAFLDSINAISRFMKKNGEDNSWYDELPDFRSSSGRKEWGDFACLIHCYLGLKQR